MTLTVSLGTQYVTVPDLTNYVQSDAEQQLKALGVSVLVTQAVDTSVASGAVIRTDPAAGTQVAAGSTVILYISRVNVVVSAGAAPAQEPEQPGSDGTSGTTGEGSTGGESTGGSSEPSSSSSSTGGGILDWWSSLLG